MSVFKTLCAISVAAIGTTAGSQGVPGRQPGTAPATPQQLRLLSRMTGFAATARTTGGLGHSTFVVRSAEDSPQPGTLRWAVRQAANEGGGWIGFAPALAGANIRLNAQITMPANVTLDGGAAAPTLIGAPGQAILVIMRVSNVVVTNLRMRGGVPGPADKGNGDCITVARGADRIWIANNLIGRCGDGQIDITQNGDPRPMRVTIASNHFTAHDKVSVIQGNDVGGPCGGPPNGKLPGLDVTFYRNFFDGTGQRHPRAGGAAYVHWVENVVNFVPQDRAQIGHGGAYGAAVTDGAAMLVERSLYRAVDTSPRNFRFVDTQAIPASPGACATKGRLRIRRLVTFPASQIAENQPETVPNPPYRINAGSPPERLNALFATVTAEAGPRH